MLTGEGRSFCAGFNLNDLALDPPEDMGRIQRDFYIMQRMCSDQIVNMRRCEQPIIGALKGFAVGGGVAAAVVEAIKHIDPDREILIEYGDGLKECRKMLAMAKAGKRNGYLLEGMGCPGGCVAGAGTLRPVKESTASVERFKNAASSMSTTESPYLGRLKDVEEKC